MSGGGKTDTKSAAPVIGTGGEIRLLTGNDPTLLTDAVKDTVELLAVDIDRSTNVHEFFGEEYLVGELVLAASTQPLFSSHRVVVARELSRFGSADLAPLVDYLAAPTPTTSLVLEWGAGRVPKALDDALKAAGAKKVSTTAPTRKPDRRKWLDEKLDEVGVNLDSEAAQLLLAHLGDEIARLSGLLETLESVFGVGATLSAQDIEPYLGAAGRVPPWDLTDAIDAGNISNALRVLQRMWQAGMAPMQVMTSLGSHYNRILRLDGVAIGSNEQAAELLGQNPNNRGSVFSAGKALAISRKMGHASITRAVELLARADSEVRGVSGLDDRCVMEILVGRLAAMCSRR